MTWAPLHLARVKGGLWFFRYCRKVFQSLRFCDSYLLGAAEDDPSTAAGAGDGPVSVLLGSGVPEPDAVSIHNYTQINRPVSSSAFLSLLSSGGNTTYNLFNTDEKVLILSDWEICDQATYI